MNGSEDGYQDIKEIKDYKTEIQRDRQTDLRIVYSP